MLTEAQELGVLQCHLSGGEPLLRRDLPRIVATASELGMYPNLVTSAVGLSRRRADELRAAGLDRAAPSPRERPGGLPFSDLGPGAALPEFPGDGLDAGPVPRPRPP